MIDRDSLARSAPHLADHGFADLVLDFTVPAMAALLTIGLFLLALH